MFRLDADAAVGDAQHDLFRIRVDLDRNQPARGRVLDRVVDEVCDRAAEQVAVASDPRQRFLDLAGERLFLRAGSRKHQVDDAPRDGRHVDGLARGQCGVVFQPRKVEQIVHQIAKLAGVLGDRCQKTRRLLRVSHRAVQKRFDESRDDCQRRAKFVADVCDEFLTKFLVTPRLGDIMRDDNQPGIAVAFLEPGYGDLQKSTVNRADVDHLPPAR